MRPDRMVVAIGMCLVLLLAAGSAEAKYPSKPIVLVAELPGGGTDVQCRFIQAAIERNFTFDEPVVVLNKGGREPYTFVAKKKGDPHYIISAANLFLSYPMVAESYNVKDFTPIANLVFDVGVMVALPNSKFKSFADVVKAAKENPNGITIGGGRVGSQDHMAGLTVMQAAGIKLRFVHFPGGSAVHKNILGGQVDVAIGNPSDFISSLEAGTLKGLVVTTTERVVSNPATANIPTLKELGHDGSFVTWRGVLGPAGLNEEDLVFLSNMFKKILDDAKFKEEYINRNALVPAHMDHKKFSGFLNEQEVIYRKFLREAGVIK